MASERIEASLPEMPTPAPDGGNDVGNGVLPEMELYSLGVEAFTGNSLYGLRRKRWEQR